MKRYCKKCELDTERYASGRCKQCARASVAKYKESNKDKIHAKASIRYFENRDRMLSAVAKWSEANREKVRARVAKWNADNPEKRRIIHQNRRARKRANGGKLSHGIAEKLFNLQNGKCPCCKLPLGDDYQLDHIIPLALGGKNIDSNIQLLRKRCNNQKRAKHPIDFMQSKGYLL